jgi:hypothetical protein
MFAKRRAVPLLFLALGGVLGATAFAGRSRGEKPAVAPASVPTPVVVELFSSEGCSSCPPADVLLQKLDGAGTVGGARVLALEFHVDYWNDLGWKDPFSRADWSERQQNYARMRIGGTYTPEMIVDGRDAFVGSDSSRARDALARAASRPHAHLQVSRVGSEIHIRVPKLDGAPATAWFAVAERGHRTEVPRGENAGTTLVHGPVVTSLTRLAGDPAAGFESVVPLKNVGDRFLYVAFVQRDDTREIIGSAAL